MRRHSIRLRLVAAGGAAVLAALVIAAAGLDVLFERHVQRRAVAELSTDLDQLAAGLERGPDGRLTLAASPTDPRFTEPLSGLYWQAEVEGDLLRSRSLWDGRLDPAGQPPLDGVARETFASGPQGEDLLVLERRVALPARLGGQVARTAVAMDRAELRGAARAFVRDLVPYLGLLGAVLIAAGWAQLVIGLRPLAAVGARVSAVRSGSAARLGADFPEELLPLAAEVDALIDARETEIARARVRAGDLAHGLKTPLQALMGEADRLRDRGEIEAAEGLDEVARAMSRHVDRELARARMAPAGRHVSTGPAAVLDRLVSVLRRTPDGARVAWRIDAPRDLRARVDPDDLAEALGALLENAARHAAETVTVMLTADAGHLTLSIRDDGPGIPLNHLDELVARGGRLDSAGPGNGLGLAIATEIAVAAGGDLRLNPGAEGLEARLTLPAAPR
ncbi:HAMP domain-containing sensor histidine kinase [uncultured Amaricoccus sp.]|uniref:sensor histidine kinase n=1 Tax=uncultured Amaricoccus sp. TaxID=339341 RepID=UPI002616A600|nr:HAMP domain-containing sensor histidine kinase [uncultured Amaricoccus sp.]